MKKKIFKVSILMNIVILIFLLIVAINYKERIHQRLITYRNSADIVMFGDSHIAFGEWNSLIDGYSVKRIGWGGYTSDQLSPMIDQSFEYKPEYVFILCGGNDIGGRCFNIDNVIKNYKVMADTLKKHNIKPVFQKLLYQYDNPKFNSIIDSINLGLNKHCQNENIDFIDITLGMMDSMGLKQKLTIDGKVHLNEDGYEIWSKWVNKYLESQN